MDIVIQIATDFWLALCEMAPYLLFGFAVAGVLSVLVSPRMVERHLGGGLISVVKAAILGIPLPLCSCGVIPVGASLRRHGASAGATTSFLISTPQTGVDSMLVTYSMLGGVIALLRPIAAFVSGVLGGALVSLMGAGRAESPAAANEAGDACSADGGGNRIVRMLRYGFVTLPGDIGRPLLVGLLIAGAIGAVAALVPDVKFGDLFGRGFVAMAVMLAVGVPFYVCATASVPVAVAMIAHQGVSPGAALVFLMTGPATNAATLTTIWKIMGRKAAVLYVGAVMVTALGSGVVLDSFFPSVGDTVTSDYAHAAEHGAGWVGAISAIALVIVLLPAVVGSVVSKWGARAKKAESLAGEGEWVLDVQGMTCSHCAGAVERALTECVGVTSVSVDLAASRAVVAGDNVDVEALCEAVSAVGYAAEAAGKGGATNEDAWVDGDAT